MNEELQALTVEQYLWWQSRGLTHREMMTACRRPWRPTMTGDDVVEELASAWNGLERCDEDA